MKIIATTIIACLFVLWCFRKFEYSNVFYPDRNIDRTPSIAYQNVYFKKSGGARLNGWYFENPDAKYTMIFAHGNAGNIADREEKIRILLSAGLSIFIFDYSGYGNSDGISSESALYSDMAAAYRYAADTLKPKGLVLYGESLGGAPVIDFASKNDHDLIKGVIVEGTFTSARDMAKIIYPFLPGFLLGIKLDNIAKINEIHKPILVLHATSDEVIPFALGKRLFERANEPKYFRELAGGHSTAYADATEEYVSALKDFLKRI